jgi:hypothetical protein
MVTANRLSELHVVCYRWGSLYSVDYVNRLYAMVKRNLPAPFTFHCVTDDPDSLAAPIIAHPLPDYGIDGIWRKLMTFQRDFLHLEGKYVVSFDVDVVITGSLDFLLDRPAETFMIARNWGRKAGGARGSGSVYRLKVGAHTEIWEQFIADPGRAIDQFHGKNRLIGEQNWLDAHFPEFAYFPEGKVVSFKRHCQSRGFTLFGAVGDRWGLTTACFGKAKPPASASVISFHGEPLPADVVVGRHGRWRHAPFVAEHWRVGNSADNDRQNGG